MLETHSSTRLGTWLHTLPTSVHLVVMLVAGALITFSFAPFHAWPIGILSVTLLILSLGSCRRPLLAASAFGFAYYASGIHWIYTSIHHFGNASPVFASVLVGLFAAFMAVVFLIPFYAWNRWLKTLPFGLTLSVAVCWALGEWSRTWFLTGFPWLFLGYAHHGTWLAGWAPVTGVIGLSFMVALTASLIAYAMRRRVQARHATVGLAVIGACWLGGLGLTHISWTQLDENSIKIGMVQPNVDQSIKLRFDPRHSEEALAQLETLSEGLWENDWVIWPEAAIPSTLTYQSALPFLEKVNTQAATHQTALFTGVIYEDRERRRYYNSVAGLGEGYGFYHKRRLVPFGEYVPLEDQLRGLIEFFNLPTSFIHLGPKTQHGLIAKGIRITPAVCYEIVYPDLIAKAARDTQVLLNVSNLGWFLDSIQSKQFMQMAQMRALETGRYLAYSTNNGPSAIIDSRGHITAQSTSFDAQSFTGTAYAATGITPFMRWGSTGLIALLSIVLALLIFIARTRQATP